MSRAKVLVVHEEPYFPRIMQFHLEGAGFETIMSDKRDEILSLIARHRPDFVVVSVTGEVKWAVNLMAEIFRDPANQSMRVIPVAKFFTENEVATLLRSGACGYMVEPFRPPQLLAMIKKCSSNTPSAGS